MAVRLAVTARDEAMVVATVAVAVGVAVIDWVTATPKASPTTFCGPTGKGRM